MATDFMNVTAHSVVFVRCIKPLSGLIQGNIALVCLSYFQKLLFTSLFFDYNKIKRILAYMYATKFSCLNEHLSFAANLQKSQFVGIVKSRAGNVLYPIAKDIAETKNITIYN